MMNNPLFKIRLFSGPSRSCEKRVIVSRQELEKPSLQIFRTEKKEIYHLLYIHLIFWALEVKG